MKDIHHPSVLPPLLFKVRDFIKTFLDSLGLYYVLMLGGLFLLLPSIGPLRLR